MSDETAIVQQEMVQLGTLHVAPEAVIERATAISKALARVIEDRKLYKQIGQKRHVLVEGWNTLGAMVGISPKEREVNKIIEDSGTIEYEAYIDLVRNDDGKVIGGASSICRTEENNWQNKPLYAVRSMAVTRATGKAFRLKLSWIMELAGFSPTPAEEMDFVEGEYTEAKHRIENQWEQEIIDKLVDLQLVQARPHAVNILNRSPFMSVPYHQLEMVEAVAYVYGWQQLKENIPDMSTDERNAAMNKSWAEGNNEDCLAKAIEMLGG